jgi:hypothetical protein
LDLTAEQRMASISSRELTLADLLEQFGPIPMARIRTCPKPGCATQQDVIDLETTEDRLFELVDGVLVEKVMGHYESFLASVLRNDDASTRPGADT